MAEETKKELPKTVFVKRVVENDVDEYLSVYEEEDDAVDDDGEVIEVGVYELKRTKRMRKVAQEV